LRVIEQKREELNKNWQFVTEMRSTIVYFHASVNSQETLHFVNCSLSVLQHFFLPIVEFEMEIAQSRLKHYKKKDFLCRTAEGGHFGIFKKFQRIFEKYFEIFR
jgi:hypothetical protein